MPGKHPFDEWWDSNENPFRTASEAVQHFVKPGVRHAYRAGGKWVIAHLKDPQKERYDDAPFSF